MGDGGYSLAIETSGGVGSVTLGRGDEVLGTQVLPDPSAPPRHRIDLMPTIDALCGRFGVGPGELGEVSVCVGPGSFTGLRIGITTAKTLGQVLGVRLVGVGALDVWAASVSPDEVSEGHLAVCLNVKGEAAYTGLFEWAGDESRGGAWVERGQRGLRTIGELLDAAPRPLSILSDGAAPAGSFSIREKNEDGITYLTRSSGAGLSEVVWRLGREAAREGRFVGYEGLEPVYARPPEAQEVWDRRYGVGRGPGAVTVTNAVSSSC